MEFVPESKVFTTLKDKAKEQEFHAVESQVVQKNHDIHLFYYTWYRSEKYDGYWKAWDSPVVEHWDREEETFTTSSQPKPPLDISSNFYPMLGPYSSLQKWVVREHLNQIKSTGVTVVSISWFGESSYTELRMIESILDLCEENQIKANFQFEEYPERTIVDVKNGIQTLQQHFGSHNAFYRVESKNQRPLFYIRDSYRIPSEKWASILSPKGQWSIRGTKFDALVIGLYIDQLEHEEILESRFDGIYTLFGSSGFTEGSSPLRWREISIWAKEHGLLFIPTVAPGYKDTKIRPWNSHNTKQRKAGEYYTRMWEAAIHSCADFISINSFNNWAEGTQIEPAIQQQFEATQDNQKIVYDNYNPRLFDFYLRKTRELVKVKQTIQSQIDCVLGGF